MSILAWFRNQFGPAGIATRHFRYPALAEANKALIALEEEIVDLAQVSHEMDMYKRAQYVSEKKRDIAFIPIYFALERFLLEHQPPVTRHAFTRDQLREKVKSRVDLEQMNPMFHLVFSQENEQADHLLKIGAVDLMQLLLTGLGEGQLKLLVKKIAAGTPLALIKISEDGIYFGEVHPKFVTKSKAEVEAAYKQLYAGLYEEVKSFFGEQVAEQQVKVLRQKFEKIYRGAEDLLSVVINALPTVG